MRPAAIVPALLLFATPLSAQIVTRTVAYEHEGVVLEGFLAYDGGLEGRRPGVLVVHEWWGLNDYARRRATDLARLGYVAFAADMYGSGRVTKDPRQAQQWSAELYGKPLQAARSRAGLEVLRAQPQVDAQRLAAIGYCFGGTTVLALAFSGADLAGVVSFHGSLPVPPEGADLKAAVLVCHGAADPLVKPDQVQAFTDAMNRLGADWHLVSYGGAVHGFTNPDAGGAGMPAVAYHGSADRRSWQHMRLFFDEIFGGHGGAAGGQTVTGGR